MYILFVMRNISLHGNTEKPTIVKLLHFSYLTKATLNDDPLILKSEFSNIKFISFILTIVSNSIALIEKSPITAFKCRYLFTIRK